MKLVLGFLIVFATTHLGVCQTNPNIIRCRHCTRATNIELCSQLTACDKTTQSCYMDQFITTDAKIYYTGGCRDKTICQASSSTVFGKKRDDGDLKSCSRCCSSGDDCNKRLCGIGSETLASQCYSCDSLQPNGDQGLVDDPLKCTTLDYCQSDEICLSYTRKTTAGDKYGFRCEKLKVCDLLMERVLLDYHYCHDKPDPNLCGILDRKRSTDTCFACCGEGGCNSRTCEELKEYIWTLKNRGALNETSWRPL